MSLFSVFIAYIHKIFSFLLSLASKSLILTNLTMTKLPNRLTGLKVAQSCSNQIHILCMTMRQNRVGSILFRISIFWRGDHERWLTKSSILMAKGRFFIVMRGTERLQVHDRFYMSYSDHLNLQKVFILLLVWKKRLCIILNMQQYLNFPALNQAFPLVFVRK